MVEILFRKISFTVLVLLATVVIASAGMMAGIYYGGWRGSAVEAFAKVVPIPAAQVNGRYIPLRRLQEGKTLDELIEEEIILQIAVPYGAESREELEIALVKEKSNLRARQARVEISQGVDFSKVAAKYSDDEESKYIGGDLGFLVMGDLPDWMREAVEPLEVGQMSGIIAGPDGFHIYQATARDNESDPPRKQIRQIFVKIDSGLDKLIEQKMANSKIYVFVK